MNKLKILMSKLLLITVITTVAPATPRVYAIGGNENGGTFEGEFDLTPPASMNTLDIKIVQDVKEPTNDNVNIVVYATQSVNYIVRYAKLIIPEFELVEGSQKVTGAVTIKIPDLNATLVGNGTGSGEIAGSVSGQVSGTASGSVSGSYSSGGWYGGGSGSVSGTVQGQVGGNVAGSINVALGGTLTGVISGYGDVTGTSSVNMPTYTLKKNMDAEYNVPYVIPVNTQIITPDGAVNGNMAKFTAKENGTYNFTVKDTLGNVKTQSITIDNIDKGDLDIKQYYIEKTKDSNGVMTKKLVETSIDKFSNVRAYVLNSNEASTTETFGFFIKVKDTSSDLNYSLLTDSGGIGLPVKSQVVSVSATEFYTKEASQRAVAFTSLAALADGIYVQPGVDAGYKIMFIKATQPKSLNSIRTMSLSIENNAGTKINKAFRVEIEDIAKSYITAPSNYTITKDKKTTVVFTRDSKVVLNNMTDVYDTEMYSSSINLKDKSQNNIVRFEPRVSISNSFKDVGIRTFELMIDKNKQVSSYDVGLVISDQESKATSKVLHDNNYSSKLYVINKPIDAMLDLSTLKQTVSGDNIAINYTAKLKTSGDYMDELNKIYTSYGVDITKLKINLVDYSNSSSSGLLKFDDLKKLEDALLDNTAKSMNQTLNANVRTSSDIRLVFGIPGVFVDVAPLSSDLVVNLYNVDETQPYITDITEENPFIINANIDSNGFKYTLPRDIARLKEDKQIQSLKLQIDSNVFDITNLSEEEAIKAFNIVDEGVYNVKLEVVNIYGIKRTDTKVLKILKTDTIKNSLRLKNDPSILLTKEGIYDIHSKKFNEFKLTNIVDSENGLTLMGIRLTNNNIVIVNSKDNKGEIFTSSLDSLGTFNLASTALDIIEYGTDVLIANGINGVSILNGEKPESNIGKTLPVDSTIKAPVYCLERLNSMLIIGSENAEALRVYVNSANGGFDLKEKLSAAELYEDGSSTQVKGITVRNNKLEVYPGFGDHHVIIELP